MSSFSFAIARHSRPMPARYETTDTTATLAQLLHFLMDARELTPSAHALLTLPHTARFARLAIAFGESTCGRAWAKWAGVDSLVDTAPDSAEKFLAEASALSDATIKRRAAALRNWHVELLPHHPARQVYRPSRPMLSNRPPQRPTCSPDRSRRVCSKRSRQPRACFA